VIVSDLDERVAALVSGHFPTNRARPDIHLGRQVSLLARSFFDLALCPGAHPAQPADAPLAGGDQNGGSCRTGHLCGSRPGVTGPQGRRGVFRGIHGRSGAMKTARPIPSVNFERVPPRGAEVASHIRSR
jgi:hypothetical protein